MNAFAVDNLNSVHMMEFVFYRLGNILGIGENAGYQYFLLFPKCFQKTFFFKVVKTEDCVVKSQMKLLGT